MSSVYKYTLGIDGLIEMPVGAKILTVATQHGNPTIWAEVPDGGATCLRQFEIVPTGANFDPTWLTYLGTCHDVANQGLVFHIYEKEIK